MRTILLYLSTLLAVSAAPFVTDPFADGNHTAPTADPGSLVWYRTASTAGSTLAVIDDTSVVPSSKALSLSTTSTFRGFLAFFPAKTPAVGQTLSLQFDFRFTALPINNSNGFRFGIFDSGGTQQTADANNATREGDRGYGIWTNPGLNGTSTRLFVESGGPVGSGADILGGATPYELRGVGSNGSSFDCGDTARHTALLRITPQANGNVFLEARIDNGTTAVGTVTAVADRFTTFDTIAFANGGVTQSFLIDNVTVTLNAKPTVALTSPLPNTLYPEPASIHLAATATDDNGISKVEFYRGTTKLGEDSAAPYEFDWLNPSAGFHDFKAVAIDVDGETAVSSPVDVRVTGGAPDEFDTLRERWRLLTTGGAGYNLADPEIANRVTAITNGAQIQWTNMDKSPTRTYLWSDAASPTISAHIETNFSRLRAMALAYATHGSSLEGNAALLADILGGLDWMHANRYSDTRNEYDNWYQWEIGAPLQLVDILVLLYDELSPTQLMNQARAIERFAPNGERFINEANVTTGANRAWKSQAVTVRGVIVKDAGKLAAARDAHSSIFPYVTSGDGFYLDGSFIQHAAHPYNGGYGNALLITLAETMALTNGSTWAVTDPASANVFAWVYKGYDPFLFRGALMDCIRGRELSRSSNEDHVAGHSVITSLLMVAEFAPAADALYYRRAVKALIQADTSRSFLTTASLPSVLRAKSILNDGAITPRPELVTHRQFPGMDRVIHWRPGFAFALSMCSSRIYAYESINGENLRGWYQSDGATYLYNSDIDEYSSAYWPTVNSYRLAGITVDPVTRTNGSAQSTFSTKNWVGGAEILGLYGSAGMELDSSGSTLTARKSWFMFDDEIVALGSGITSTDNRAIETIIENRRLKIPASALTVDGVVKPATLGWSETMSNVGWAHLAATGGYVFPGGATVRGLRESRTGAWQDINTGGSATTVSRDYATLWFEHGANPNGATYAYTLLPNKTAAQTGAYAAAPDVVILENSSVAHCVRERRLNLTAANFWEDGLKTVGMVTTNKKSAVLTRETASSLDVALSDPTQLNVGTITIELSRSATSVTSKDPEITIVQLSPIIRFTANMNGTRGRALKAVFALPLAVVNVNAVDADAGETGNNKGTFAISRTGTATAEFTVGLTVGGSASPGTDYTTLPSTLTFLEGETIKNLDVTPSADTTPEGDETITFTLSAGSDYTVGGTGNATITLRDTPIDGWRHSHFAGNLALAADLLDPDKDGASNLLEYGTGGDPNESLPLDLVPGRNGFLSLTYTRSKFAPDLNFIIETSPNITSWAPATVTEEVLSETATTQRIKATELTPLGDAIRRFIRLKVERVNVP